MAGPHFVRPVVVVGHPAQGGLDAAGHHGHPLEGLPAALGIDPRGPVRAQADLAPGRVGVGVSAFPVGRVVVDHGVHVARAHRIKEPRRPEGAPRVGALPIGLGQDDHAKTVGLEPAAEQARCERGVVHVGIPRNEHHIGLIPAQGVHFRPGRGQKLGQARLGRGALGLLAGLHG